MVDEGRSDDAGLVAAFSAVVIAGRSAVHGQTMVQRLLLLLAVPGLSFACADPQATADTAAGTSTGRATSESTGGPTSSGEPSTGASGESSTNDTTGSSSSSAAETSGADDPTSSTTDACSAADEGTTGAPAPWDCIDVGSGLGEIASGDWSTEVDDIPLPATGSCTLHWDAPDTALSWTAPEEGWYRFTASNPGGLTAVSLFDACGETPLDCQLGHSRADVTAYLMAGQSIAVVAEGGDPGFPAPYSLRVDAMPECSPATDLGDDLFFGVAGDVAGQGDDVNATCWLSQDTAEDQTFTWVAPATGIVSLEVTSASFAGAVAVYRGSCGHTLDLVGCYPLFAAAFFARESESYTIVVDSFTNSPGTAFTLGITAAPALAGDCCETDGSAGCEDDDITECVCAIEPYCCAPQQGWTDLCTGLAASHCEAPCPALPPGNCCEPHAGLSCDQPELAACACEIHFQCCARPDISWPWDDYCVGLVAEHCNADCC